MSRIKISRVPLAALAVAFSLVLCARSPEAQDAAESARQFVAAADDDAVSLEGRQEALRKLEEAAGLFLSAGEREEAARALNRAGRLQLLLNAPKDALETHSRALSLLKD